MNEIAVFGSGAWGTALASVWSRNGRSVTLWAFPEKVGIELGCSRTHPRLPMGTLPESLRVVTDPCEAFDADMWVSALPTQASPEVWERMLKTTAKRPKLLIHVSKGILQTTYGRLSQALRPILSVPVGVLSGPSFADEVFRQLPAAVVLALPDEVSDAESQDLQALLASPRFRVYLSRDVVGVELCGALKNVLAIAAGLLEALNLGMSARASLLTRGLAEMLRLVDRLGGRPETVMGLAGMGDLLLTATGHQSRNRKFGELIGRGMSFQQAAENMGEQVVEGVHTAKAALALANETGVELPITNEVIRLLDGEDPRKAVDALMLRDLKAE
ncbi:MAG: NAD(P)-dependent glycerol-3-phosphate dehydrogenase [Holophagales bacterium]|jgi:glycerol-3-phosphate dehydrogenase (NAD(P)+)|nr:NAD(P)-dependent glycerol-3-phosphate dehydrogenase [Holophagales bacterium]